MRTKKTPPTVVKTVVERQQVTKHGVLRFYWTQGRTIVSRTIKGSPETRDLTNTDETYTYAIGHDKIPYRIEMVWRFGSFSGLRPALNIPHIIEFSSTIYQAFDMGSTECTDLIRLFYNFQVTLTEFQVLLETRQITPHSRVGNRSLFEVHTTFVRSILLLWTNYTHSMLFSLSGQIFAAFLSSWPQQ